MIREKWTEEQIPLLLRDDRKLRNYATNVCRAIVPRSKKPNAKVGLISHYERGIVCRVEEMLIQYELFRSTVTFQSLIEGKRKQIHELVLHIFTEADRQVFRDGQQQNRMSEIVHKFQALLKVAP